MAVDFIGGASSQLQNTVVQQSALGQEEFLRILLAQLQFQDPLKPLDNQEFLAQMAQFSSLAQTSQINERIDTLLTIQATTQSIGLIGKTVEVQTTSLPAVGTVTSLAFSEGQPNLTIRTADGELLTGIRLSQVSVVR
ncbi:flagellar hook capping protein [Pseudomethylobacillus aquaticus]|uniref:Basal-body rod modification protein FlgD n=1 Tax=Pseudomethylobacillus aquaticus TaxID=2676064 RepID=A0A3N0V0D0_9PROT|nr:flagellar hook capping FlgD N-terminal domain-containing protein [Pseudomethylobacillus aquaticus]ROH85938.1 flagellar hook capping protein [Pseudomethylobacillus aquaticus]